MHVIIFCYCSHSIAYLDNPHALRGQEVPALSYDACLVDAEKPPLATYAEGGGDAVRVSCIGGGVCLIYFVVVFMP